MSDLISQPEVRLWPRRSVLKALSAAGIGAGVFGRALEALAQEAPEVTADMVRQAEWIAGVEYTDQERERMLRALNRQASSWESLRAVPLENSVAPALHFMPAGTGVEDARGESVRAGSGEPLRATRVEAADRTAGPESMARPAHTTDLAFLSVRQLSSLLRAREVSSTELTQLYLDRLQEHDPILECVITLTPELALEQAGRADAEMAAGNWRGPLHGIPWGAKDLLAVPSYPTTWGAEPYRTQQFDEPATVVSRLEKAGAVLVAKLSSGALAWNNVWFGGETKNPWKPDQGSSGSSAGPGSATAAGLVGFSIGTETLGSIVSPSVRCGVSGLRPTFGRVSRHGAMALSWSMDKIGPMARTVADCGLVLQAIHGPDGQDPTVVERPYRWPSLIDPRKLRIGYVPAWFEALEPESPPEGEQAVARRARYEEEMGFHRRSLAVLRDAGLQLVEMDLSFDVPVRALTAILNAEAAAAFDDLFRTEDIHRLPQGQSADWANSFRQAQLMPAVTYIRANRIRTLLMREMEKRMEGVDLFVAPPSAGVHLTLTNLTGHPTVVLPNGFRSDDGTPTGISFTGRLFGEEAMLTVAAAYQEATDFHLQKPPVGG
jgi:Asp-tRNA(Asn)/Glu-tRNA(Gln) amidotransferase A subunit family amidase